jgi:hypothetical protein
MIKNNNNDYANEIETTMSSKNESKRSFVSTVLDEIEEEKARQGELIAEYGLPVIFAVAVIYGVCYLFSHM